MNNTFGVAALHCVEVIHVESPKALHARYLGVGLLSNKVEIGKHGSERANKLIAFKSGNDWGQGRYDNEGQIKDKDY